MHEILLLIPAFNEERTIGAVVATARRFLQHILVIDDGSQDSTNSKAASAGALVRRLEPNRGKGEALKAGFAYALEHRYSYVITMDADGPDRESVPMLRRAANFTSSLLVSVLCGRRILDSQTGFRSYSSALIRNVKLDCSHYDLETEVIIKAARQGLRIGYCPIRTIYGEEVSRFKNLKDSIRFLKVIVKSVWLARVRVDRKPRVLR
jgi:glycosyltransferase involved in cell wall biosynthesis